MAVIFLNHKKTNMRKILLAICMAGCLTPVFSQNGLLKKITGEKGISKSFVKLEDAEQVPFSFQKANLIFGLDENADLNLLNIETDKSGEKHYRFQQSYQGVPVENSMFLAHTKADRLTGMGGGIITKFPATTTMAATASLSGTRAIDAALNYVHASKYAWQDAEVEQRIKLRKGNAATYYPVPEKIWFAGVDQLAASAIKLAYKIDVYSLQPLDRRSIYVDAKTGAILGSKSTLMRTDAVGTAATGFSGTQTIHSDLNGASYRLRDLTKGNGILTLHAATGHADYTSTTANWALTGADQWALDAHFGVASTWTYYKNNFNRNSVDNAGFALTSWVNDAATTDNAYWDGTEMVYGNLSSNGKGLTAIDITAHELTHGVTQFTCNLVYSKEPGAMNESMSDIMGKSVQFYTKPTDNSWILSNDLAWEIRSFANPNADGQPDTYKGTYWVTSSTDNYGVHTNSGVGNFMFYLLVTGGSGTNDIGSAYTVSGLGLAKADQIMYRTQSVYLTSTSQYADWRTASINAATDLYGAGSNEVIQVQNAWYAVGIGAAGGTACTAPSALTVAAITNTSATFSWTGVAGSTGYAIQYRPVGTTIWSTGTSATVSFNASGLTAGTNYEVQVKNNCSATSSSSFTAAVNFTTTGTAPCIIPTGMTTTAVTSSSAIFSWAAAANASSYTIQYRVVGASTWTSASSTTSTYTASGLALSTNYEWQVQSTCVGGGTSGFTASTNFSTLGITYCTSVGGKLDGITNVTFNTINNTTSATTIGYTDYTATQSTAVSTGSAYILSVKQNTGGNYTNYAKAWIDWNHDGIFSTTTEEYNLGTTLNATSGVTSLSPSITVPAGAYIGTTRMRVSSQYNAVPSPCTASFDGEVEDYSIVVSVGSSCVTPSGLAASAITNTSAIVGWNTVTGATGYTLQWKLSSATAWTTVSGLTANTYNLTGLTAGLAYQFQVATVCSATSSSTYSSPVIFTTTGGTVTYCASRGTSTYEYIKTVVLNSINHTVANDGGYGNFTTLSTGLTAGLAYTIKLTPGFASTTYTEYWTVYIDYNQNGVLNGTGELVASGSGTGTTIKSLTFTVPITSKNGATRIRIQMSYGSSSTNPCATLTYGDVHDYTVNISGGTGLQAAGLAAIDLPSQSATSMVRVWPNPVNTAAATVQYLLPSEGKVTLAVVDILGRVSKTVNLGNQSEGTHTYILNKMNELKSGNYHIVLYHNNAAIGRNKVILTNK
jgi:Zn-dependent metalloprotease